MENYTELNVNKLYQPNLYNYCFNLNVNKLPIHFGKM